MDKPKTPEESKFSEDDFKYYTDTIVRIMKNAICKKGSTPNDAIDELNSFFAQAISAERKANLEKIKGLEAEAKAVRSALEWIKKILPNTNDQIDHILKERSHELYHILCVDVPDVVEQAINEFRGEK